MVLEKDSFEGIPDKLSLADEEAAQDVVTRYARRLIGLARSRLDCDVQVRVAPDDVAQSVFNSFFQRQQADQFELENWDGLWALLARITIRKCNKHNAAHRAARRDVRRERRSGDAHSDAHRNWDAADRDPLPEESAVFNETLAALLASISADKREWLVLRLQGYTVEEISDHVGRTQRSVYRLLNQVRGSAVQMALQDSP